LPKDLYWRQYLKKKGPLIMMRKLDKGKLYPFSSGTTFPTAFAAPVEAGMMFWEAPRPSLHIFPEGPSTVFCVAVTAWTVLWKSKTCIHECYVAFPHICWTKDENYKQSKHFD